MASEQKGKCRLGVCIHSATALGHRQMRLRDRVCAALKTKATSKSLGPKARVREKSTESGLSLCSHPGTSQEYRPCGPLTLGVQLRTENRQVVRQSKPTLC